MSRRLFFLPALMLSLLLSACSSTSLTGSWVDPEARTPVTSVLVIGLGKTEVHRRIFEDSFRDAMGRYGVRAITSYRFLPQTEKMTREQIEAAAANSGAKAILIARTVAKRTEQVVTPARTYVRPTTPYYPHSYYRRGWYDYYSRSYEIYHEPARVSEFQVVTVESTLYDAQSDKLLWSAESETIVDQRTERLIRDFVDVVTKDLHEKGLL